MKFPSPTPCQNRRITAISSSGSGRQTRPLHFGNSAPGGLGPRIHWATVALNRSHEQFDCETCHLYNFIQKKDKSGFFIGLKCPGQTYLSISLGVGLQIFLHCLILVSSEIVWVQQSRALMIRSVSAANCQCGFISSIPLLPDPSSNNPVQLLHVHGPNVPPVRCEDLMNQ